MKFNPLKFLAAATAAVLGIQAASAQKLDPPTEPVLKRAPKFSSWTITFTYPTDEAASAPAEKTDVLKSRTIAKTDATYSEKTLWESGQKEEKWIFDGFQMRRPPGTNFIAFVSPPDIDHPQPDYSDYSRTDFPELAWISRDAYLGIKQYEGKPVHAFETTDGMGQKLNAMLSAEQLPVYYSDPRVILTYKFNEPPTSPLVPPENFRRELERNKKGLELLKRHPSPP